MSRLPNLRCPLLNACFQYSSQLLQSSGKFLSDKVFENEDRSFTKSQSPCTDFVSLNALLKVSILKDYEIADITFNLWYRLSEELFQRKDENLTKCFQ